MPPQDPEALAKNWEIQTRAAAAMAAIEIAAAEIASQQRKNASTLLPYHAVRGILLDLFDGCWDAGYSAGEDCRSNRPNTND